METPPPDNQPPMQSPYPRYSPYGYGPQFPRPAEINFNSIGEAWGLITQDLGTWAAGSLCYFVLVLVIGIPVALGVNYLLYGSLLGSQTLEFNAMYFAKVILGAIIQSAIYYPLMSGMYYMALKRLRGQPYGLGDVFSGFRHFGPLMVAGMIVMPLQVIGFYMCLIPGVLLMGLTAFVPLLIMDQKAGPIEAIQLSIRAIGGKCFLFGILILVANIIVGLSALLCVVPVLFTMPILFFVVAMHYYAFFPPELGPEFAPGMPVAPQYSA